MSNDLEKLLSGGDLRSIGKNDLIVRYTDNQEKFDRLFHYLTSYNRLWAMRAADVIEKITKEHPEYLQKHKSLLFELLISALNKELKWHLALILPRLSLTSAEKTDLFVKLSDWILDNKESKIVRANSLQGISEIVRSSPKFYKGFQILVLKIRNENIPSLNARIKKLS